MKADHEMNRREWIDRQLKQSAQERSAWPDWLKASRGLDADGHPVHRVEAPSPDTEQAPSQAGL